jgi:membrane protease YdiL (CAAX protease family)
MSILHLLAVAVPVTQPTTAPASPGEQLIGSAIFVIPALIVAWLAGVFRRRSICGPVRVGPEQSLSSILLPTAIGGGAWFLAQAIYGGMRAAQFMRNNAGKKFDASAFTDFDFAFLATVPAIFALIVLIVADRLSGQNLPRRLGYTLDRLPRASLIGLLGAVIVLPLVWGSSGLLDMLYRAIRFQHPSEHELLGAMKEASALVRQILVFGACVMAPVFEEVFFRGHVQTLLARLFTSTRPTAAPSPPPLPLIGSGGFQSTGPAVSIAPVPYVVPLDYAGRAPSPPAVESAHPRRLVWLAVIITSMLFAAVHPLWTAPLIFLLSVCLGYAYERTGNLWVPILIHALFNTFSTITFLNFM